MTEIRQVISEWQEKLIGLDQEVITNRRNQQNRTIKQILGHLIDSATNNHQRMVRLQYNQPLIFPDYTQDNDLWIALQDYQHADWNHLVQLWKFYNLHIIQVIRSVNPDTLSNYWTDSQGNRVTLQAMIEGYISHLYLHMDQIRELIES
ncbi:MAG: DinB family protein [Tannerellaceae bacterium]|nr:DinB family protein [Tannerellaceae bacterium]